MGLTLSLSTNPFVNRFAEPEDLVHVLAADIGIGHVQLTHEFINPSWPAPLIRRMTGRMAKACAAERLKITSMMTGPYGRLNHFGHPDRDVRRYYVDWFKTLADIAADLGCPAIGTQYAILTYRDEDDPARRGAIMAEALACWHEVAEHAEARGLGYLFWETDVGRPRTRPYPGQHARAHTTRSRPPRSRSRSCRWSTSTMAT